MESFGIRHIAGSFSCGTALVLLWRFPDWDHPLTYALAYVQCLLLFAAGLLVMGVGSIRTGGITVCLAAIFSFVRFPRDSSPGSLVLGYFLCLEIFSAGVLLACL